jgi:hypothetical protein
MKICEGDVGVLTVVAWKENHKFFEFGVNAKAYRLRRKLTEISLTIGDPLRLVSKQHFPFWK